MNKMKIENVKAFGKKLCMKVSIIIIPLAILVTIAATMDVFKWLKGIDVILAAIPLTAMIIRDLIEDTYLEKGKDQIILFDALSVSSFIAFIVINVIIKITNVESLIIISSFVYILGIAFGICSLIFKYRVKLFKDI